MSRLEPQLLLPLLHLRLLLLLVLVVLVLPSLFQRVMMTCWW